MPCVFDPLEDAWLSDLALLRFVKFMAATPPECLVAMVETIQRARDTGKPMTEEQLRGWAIESRGYLTERRDELGPC